MSSGSSDSGPSADQHIPLQTGTVMQVLPGATASGEGARQCSYQLELKQAPSIKQPSSASYALLAASDIASQFAPAISIGSTVTTAEWQDAGQAEDGGKQLQQQAAMLSSSEVLRKAAHTALQRLVPLLAFPCR